MKLQDLDFKVWNKLEICIEHPVTATFTELENVDIGSDEILLEEKKKFLKEILNKE